MSAGFCFGSNNGPRRFAERIALPESGAVAHVSENAVALSLTLTPEEVQTLDAVHPGPGR